MPRASEYRILALIACVALVMSCSSAPTGNNGNSRTNTGNVASSTPPVKDDVEELETLIVMPFEPEEASWRNEAGTLTAVIRFTAEDSKKLLSKLADLGGGKPASVALEDWFPSELEAKAEISGDKTIEGTSYPATDFLQPPFITGSVVSVPETNLFVLELKQGP